MLVEPLADSNYENMIFNFAIESGITPRYPSVLATSTLLGHASSMVTEKVYATLLPNTIAERVGDKLNIKLE